MGYKKSDVDEHSCLPAVNVKVYDFEPDIFPIHMGSSYPGGHPELIEHSYTADDFNWQWIEKLDEDTRQAFWNAAAEDGYEQACELASEHWKAYIWWTVKAYSAGRSGGWIEVHGLPSIDTWDAVMLSLWRGYETRVKAIVADQWRRYAELIYMNVYESEGVTA